MSGSGVRVNVQIPSLVMGSWIPSLVSGSGVIVEVRIPIG